MKRFKTMDKILVLLGIFLFAFTVVMIFVFLKVGSVPDTLITCVFALCGCEGGILGWIKTNKDKLTERKEENNETRRN